MAQQNTGILAPLPVDHLNRYTLGGSLAAAGYIRYPGAKRTFIPYREAGGKYRTGLDPNAKYLLRLPEEEREIEIERIKKDYERLTKSTGLDLSPTSDYYNFTSNLPVDKKVKPVVISSDPVKFDLDDEYDEITWNWIKAYPTIVRSLDKYQKGLERKPDAQYYTKDEKAEVALEYNKRKSINEAIGKFVAMSPTEKKQIARLMGLHVTIDSTEEAVYTQMDTLLHQPSIKNGKYQGKSPVILFDDLVKMNKALINVKDLITQALMHAVYYEKGGAIYEGSNKIADDETELIQHLYNKVHQDELLALEEKLKVKKIITSK